MTSKLYIKPFANPFKSYNIVLWLTTAIAFLLILIPNYVIDPYLIHQWESPLIKRLNPPKEKFLPWAKTFAISKYKPNAIYLGNSRTEVGLPTNLPFFENNRVFNAAISGGSLGDAIAMLTHASHFSELDTVVWGIDYWSFSLDMGNSDFDRNLVANSPFYLVWRTLLNIKRLFSIDTTIDTYKRLTSQYEKVCLSSLAFKGQRDEACIASVVQKRGGVAKAFEEDVNSFSNGKNKDFYHAMNAFSDVLNEFCQRGTLFRLYINPTHALMSDTFYWKNSTEALESWKRQLTTVVDALSASGCNIRLVDFSGFNSITTEPIPQVSGKPAMQNYWEASHYRSQVGRLILNRLFDNQADNLPADFGYELNSKTIEAHLNRERQLRDDYHRDHSQEVALLKQWLDIKE